MIDPFLLLTPALLLAVIALLRFVGCNEVFGIDETVLAPQDITVSFGKKPPQVPTMMEGPLNGVYEGLDFGSGQWTWEPGDIFFSSASPPSPRSFTIIKEGFLKEMLVFTVGDGDMTVTDLGGTNLPKSQRITVANRLQLVETGWTNSRPSAIVQVAFTPDPGGIPADLGIILITFNGFS